ncbi:MAG: carbohydrate-binding protein [Moraxellaceae bacterium]|nr:MAG: carbohydrate-binding protein [Moraxellaceae bacterium]
MVSSVASTSVATSENSAASSPVSSAVSSATSSSLSSVIESSSSSSSSASGDFVTFEAEDNFYSGGVMNAGAYVQNFSQVGARSIFTISEKAAGTYAVDLRYANSAASSKTLNIYVNGLLSTTTTLAGTGGATTWATKTEQLKLRAGVNTISYQYDAGNSGGVNLDSIAVENAQQLDARGATLAYEEYEAEDGTTNAQVASANTNFLTVEAESSGRKFVNLDATGQYVEWVAAKAANSLVVRYNIPDAANGGGTTATLSLYINDVKVKSLDLSSRYAWVYGNYPYNDNPANTKAHHFYDESHFADLTIPAGSKVRLQKDSSDTAAYYKIDLVDLEQIDNAYTMPENFVDITSYGAVANDNLDDMSSIVSAIAAAKTANKGVWIPAGKFILSGRPDISNIHVRGAGMWYTTLHGINGKGGFRGNGNNVVVADLMLDSDSIVRNDAADNPAFEGNFGSGSLLQNVWVEHMKVGFWLGAGTNGIYVVNGRVRNTWADGFNVYAGVTNSTISHFNIRNTGDDAMAMWSPRTGGQINVNNTFRFNSVQLPALANCFAVYGGQDNKVLDNIGSDTVVSAAGIAISIRQDFPGGTADFTGTTEVKRNTLNRTGGYDGGWNTTFGGLWIFADGKPITAPIVVDDLNIKNSTYDGILISYNQLVSNLTLNNIQIDGTGGYGINVGGVTGTGSFSNVSISNAALGAISNATYTIVRGEGNTGW